MLLLRAGYGPEARMMWWLGWEMEALLEAVRLRIAMFDMPLTPLEYVEWARPLAAEWCGLEWYMGGVMC